MSITKQEKILFKYIYSMLRYRHKKKGFKVSNLIPVERFIDVVKKPCNYCGDSETQVKTHKYYDGHSILVNGIDRVDSDKGYIYGNVVSCCKLCNQAKSNMSTTEFLKWIEKVYHNNFK